MPNSTHLERLSIRGFRGLERLELEDLRQLNVIVGKNDVGKTSVLEAAMLISGPMAPQVLVGIQNLRRHAVRSASDISFLLHRLDLDQKVGISAVTPRDERQLTVAAFNAALMIDAESQLSKKSGHRAAARANIVSYSSTLQATALHYKMVIKPRGPGESREFSCRLSVADAEITMTPTTVADDPKKDILSARLLVPGPEYDAELISDVLIAKRQNELLECLQSIHPSIVDIATKNDITYVDVGLDAMIPLSMCGSGFVHATRIFANCLAGNVQIFLIDEIGSGLHHSAVGPLIEALLTVSEQRDVQIFITTHSLEVLRSLEKILNNDTFDRFRDKIAAYALARTQNNRIHAYRYDCDQFTHAVSRKIEIR